MANKPTSQFTAIATLDSADRIVAYEASESELRTVTGAAVLTWLGASLDMSTIASGGALPVARGGTGITSLGTGIATFLGTPSSANLLAAITDETGTGALVFATSPTLVTPTLGVASATSLACPTFTSSAAMGFTPAAGSSFNVTLSGAGDFALNTNQLYVDTSVGNVGIGTTSPSDKLHVSNGNLRSSNTADTVYTLLGEEFVRTYGGNLYHDVASTGNSMIFRMSSGSSLDSEAMRIDSSGNVGIGTTSPSDKLHVSNGNLRSSNTADTVYTLLGDQFVRTYGGNLYHDVASTGNSVIFRMSSVASLDTEAMRINSSGNVGIGMTAPTAILQLTAGSVNTAPLKLTTGNVLTTPEAGAVEYNNTFHMTNSDATRRHVVLAESSTKTTAGAPYTNDGYITVNIGGTNVRLMTTA